RHNPLQAVMGAAEPLATADTIPPPLPDDAPPLDESKVGISSDEFRRRYSSEPDCHETLVRLRWNEGFQCPRCRQSRFTYFKPRQKYRCTGCKFQTTVRAGTIFHGSSLPLTKWFYAYYLLRSRPHITPRELSCEVGLRWNTAQRIKRMLSRAIAEGEDG